MTQSGLYLIGQDVKYKHVLIIW